jgi:hypothetical protein
MARKRRPLSILLAVLRMLLNHPAHRVNFPINYFAFGVAGHFFFGQARISCLKILRQFPDGRLPFIVTDSSLPVPFLTKIERFLQCSGPHKTDFNQHAF